VPDPRDLNEEEADLLGVALPTQEQLDAEENRKQRVELRKALLVNYMRNDLFREWMREVLNGFGTFEHRFGASVNGFPNAEETQFNMGMKAAGWYLWEVFDDLAPELASLMRRGL
jgi:hypothetical protein